MSIFRAYDIRGIVGETLTVDIVTQIGHAIGSEAIVRQQPEIVVGRDGRLSGPALQTALIDGLKNAGCQVTDIGVVPSPVLYFATHYLNTGNGVIVTGSHNPAQYNGLKIMLGGDTLSGDTIQALRKRIDMTDFINGQGSVKTVDISHAYLERITQDVKLARPFKVVVDSGNGVTGILAPQLLRALGCEVIELFCEIDGNFPNHHPDPTQLDNLQDLIKAVQENHADLGLGYDGDGDRLGVVDATGKVIWADRQLMLYSMDVLKRQTGAKVIYDVKCSRHLGEVITQHGGQPIMWKTGHSLIKSKMKETGALLAGEMSGHIFFKERWYGFDDALYTSARLLEILSQDSRPPTAVFASLPDAVSTPELKLEVAKEGEHFALMQRILDTFHFPEATLTTIDGLRVDFKAGWGLVRPSNTTPCLVIRFEASSQTALEAIQAQFREQFLALDSSLRLPF
jgi:phosphomannomutase/phosphoglucomutase